MGGVAVNGVPFTRDLRVLPPPRCSFARERAVAVEQAARDLGRRERHHEQHSIRHAREGEILHHTPVTVAACGEGELIDDELGERAHAPGVFEVAAIAIAPRRCKFVEAACAEQAAQPTLPVGERIRRRGLRGLFENLIQRPVGDLGARVAAVHHGVAQLVPVERALLHALEQPPLHLEHFGGAGRAALSKFGRCVLRRHTTQLDVRAQQLVARVVATREFRQYLRPRGCALVADTREELFDVELGLSHWVTSGLEVV